MSFRSRRRMAQAILVLAVLAAVPAWGQQRMTDVLRERLKARPRDPDLHYYLALYSIAEGDTPAGVAALADVLRLGKGFLPPRGVGFEAAWDDTAFRRVRGEMEAALPRVTAARELFRLDRGLIPEGIAHDPRTRAFYVGSVATGRVVRVDSAGTVSTLADAAAGRPLLGLAVDAARRRLYAVRTNGFAAKPGEERVNEIVAWDLDSGSPIGALRLPGAVQLNDVAVSPAGDLYVTDAPGGAVYRIPSTIAGYDTVVAPGTLPGANGLALSADGRALYVAHSTGIGRVLLAGRAVLPQIEVPPGESIAGIDGLYTDGATLVGIQNVTNPGRVLRLALRGDGAGIERVETLLSHHHPAIDEPTTGVVVGRTFALLATTQVARFTPEGTIRSPETLKPPVVLSIALDRPGGAAASGR